MLQYGIAFVAMAALIISYFSSKEAVSSMLAVAFLEEALYSSRKVLKAFSLEELNIAAINGDIMQGKVTKCDNNYNLYLDLGNNITGIIPREEVEAINIDETGFPKPNICTSKIDDLDNKIKTKKKGERLADYIKLDSTEIPTKLKKDKSYE